MLTISQMVRDGRRSDKSEPKGCALLLSNPFHAPPIDEHAFDPGEAAAL